MRRINSDEKAGWKARSCVERISRALSRKPWKTKAKLLSSDDIGKLKIQGAVAATHLPGKPAVGPSGAVSARGGVLMVRQRRVLRASGESAGSRSGRRSSQQVQQSAGQQRCAHEVQGGVGNWSKKVDGFRLTGVDSHPESPTYRARGELAPQQRMRAIYHARAQSPLEFSRAAYGHAVLMATVTGKHWPLGVPFVGGAPGDFLFSDERSDQAAGYAPKWFTFMCPRGRGECSVPLHPQTTGKGHTWHWQPAGEGQPPSREQPTLTPSINCLAHNPENPAEKYAGCGWHGHVVNGAFVD